MEDEKEIQTKLKTEKTKVTKIDRNKIKIREIESEKDLKIMDNVGYQSFNAFIGSNRKIYGTGHKFVSEILIAEYNKEIIGFIRAMHHGCIRSVGPLCVLPKYWQNGVGLKLMQALINKNKNKNITRDRLYTFANTYHPKFYMKLGFYPNYLTYRTNFCIEKNEDLIKKIKQNKNEYIFKKIDPQNKEFLKSSQILCENIYKGFNTINEIIGYINNEKLGFVYGLYLNKDLYGYCTLKYGLLSSMMDDYIGIKFAIAKDSNSFKELLNNIILLSKSMKLNNIECDIDTSNVNAFKILTNEFRFKYDSTKPAIHMGRINNKDNKYDDCFGYNSYILGSSRE